MGSGVTVFREQEHGARVECLPPALAPLDMAAWQSKDGPCGSRRSQRGATGG